MVQLDGAPVEVGDKVFHITLGWGEVETSSSEFARVRMQLSDGVLYLHLNGVTNGVKVFFWGPPEYFTPKKDNENNHKHAKMIADTVMDVIRDLK